MRGFRFCAVALLALHSFQSLAQGNESDSRVYRTALENARSKSLRAQKAINIGIEYKQLPYTFRNGHQFFLSDQKVAGEILYNNVLYTNIDLQYDLLLDEVITEHASGRKMILVKENVSEFKLDDFVFKRLSKADLDRKMEAGYYNFLVDGVNVTLLARRVKQEKREKNTTAPRDGEAYLKDFTKYYLKKDGVFTEVKNHKSIKKLLWGKNRPAIKKLKRASQEAQMIHVVKQYIQSEK